MTALSIGERRSTVFERIVVGYAGDQAGRDAVRLASTLAAACGGELTVAFPYRPLFAPVSGDATEKRVREEVSALTAGLPGLKAPTYHWTPSGWPIHGLHEMARFGESDLLVFGSARDGLADRLHISLMERMVHGAPCAVAAAPARYSERPHAELLRVGVGFSASEEGIAALHLARELAAHTGGRLEVIAGAGLEPTLATYASSSPALPQVERQIYEETTAALERAMGELGGDVPMRRETTMGDPASVLIARSRELDILILGSRAYGPLRHVLVGSVSASVMRRARCPVVVLPRGVGANTRERPAVE
jgi:nucleotide-binding universal stress UspA family protein